jgi:hypothetical protein
MRRGKFFTIFIVVAALVTLWCSSAVALSYKWQFTNPNSGQLAAYRVNGGILVAASVHTTNGCQTPFLVPERMPFLYDLKIRTTTGPIFCTQIVQDRLVSFYDVGKASIVHIKTAAGSTAVSVQRPPSRPPLP